MPDIFGTLTRFSALLPAALLAACSTSQSVSESAPRSSTPGPKRVAIVLTNHSELGSTGRATGFYLSEASHPHKVFTEAGYSIDFVSPKGGFAPLDGVDRSDPINAVFLADPAIVHQIQNTLPIPRINPADYDAIFFSGGHGTMWDFPDDPGVQNLIRAVYENGGVVAAVCHGPAAFVNARLSDGTYLVAGKQVATFTDSEEAAVKLDHVVPFLLETRLRERGARVITSPDFEKRVAVSERLVTGQNPASATGTAEAVARLLGPVEEASAGPR